MRTDANETNDSFPLSDVGCCRLYTLGEGTSSLSTPSQEEAGGSLGPILPWYRFFFFFFLGHDLICLGEEGFSQNAHFIFRYLMNTRCPGFLLSEFIQCGDIDCSDSHLHSNKSPHVPFVTVVIKTQQTTCAWVWFSSGKACSLENKSLLSKDSGGRPCSDSCVSPLLSRVGMSNIGAHICTGGEWSLAGR